MEQRTARYYEWIRLETPVIKVFQKYLEDKNWYLTFLEKRDNPQASIDFIGRTYDKETNKTIKHLAVEVRSKEPSKEEIESKWWFIDFPIAKLNEAMMFWRMKKEVYIVYLLKDKVYFLNWDYYVTHNFEIAITKKGSYIVKLPVRNFMYCGDFKS